MRKIILLFYLLGMGSIVNAQTYKRELSLEPFDKVKGNSFGYCISASECSQRIVVGCPHHKKFGTGSGAVYVYTYTGTSLNNERRIKSPEIKSQQAFGKAVDLDDKKLIIGAPVWQKKSNQVGAAYIFQKDEGGIDNWGLLASLKPSIRSSGDGFGTAVKILKDLAFVSSPRLNGKGAVFVFAQSAENKKSWKQIARLNPIVKGKGFGTSIAYDGQLLAIGAPDENEGRGAIYLFRRSQKVNRWILIKHITNDAKQRLGDVIALHKGMLAARLQKGVSGCVRIYSFKENDQLEKTQDLYPKYSHKVHGFGKSLSFYGKYLQVGAPDYLGRGLVVLYECSSDRKWTYRFDDDHQFYVPAPGSKYGSGVFILNQDHMYATQTNGMFGGKLVQLKAYHLEKDISENSVQNKQKVFTVRKEEPKRVNIDKKQKKQAKTRILFLKKNVDLGEFQENSSTNHPLQIKNDGNSPLHITNIYHSDHIEIQQKQLTIKAHDTYTLNYQLNYSVQDSSHAYIEIVSDKTFGNNRLDIVYRKKLKPIYSIEIEQNIDVGIVELGRPQLISCKMTNRGNTTVFVNRIEGDPQIELDALGFSLSPGESKLVPLKFTAYRSGKDEATCRLHFKTCDLLKEIHVRANVKAAVDDIMAKARGLILTPVGADQRLLINMPAAIGRNVNITITTGTGEVVKNFRFLNDGTAYYFIPTKDLPRGNYRVKGFCDEQNYPLGQGLLHILK